MPYPRCGSRLFSVFILLILMAGSRAFAMSEAERDQLRGLPDWMPYISCQDTKMLRQCFMWTQEDCELSVQTSAQSCLNLYKKDWSPPISQSLDEWQRRIMDCVVRDTKNHYKNLIVESMACQNRGIKP
jgi:hypothetical protein